MTPETKARQLIDRKLEQAGWVIQDMKQLNLGAAVGVIEARKDGAGANLTVTENTDPIPRPRELFHFFKPETLTAWSERSEKLSSSACTPSSSANRLINSPKTFHPTNRESGDAGVLHLRTRGTGRHEETSPQQITQD